MGDKDILKPEMVKVGDKIINYTFLFVRYSNCSSSVVFVRMQMLFDSVSRQTRHTFDATFIFISDLDSN